MLVSYRTTLVDTENNRARNHNFKIDTSEWLEQIRADRRLYGNAAELIEEHVLPKLAAADVKATLSAVAELDRACFKHNKLVIFQLCMFVWDGFKSGRYSADVWAATLGIAWQSGSRGMLAAVQLAQSQVVEMFKSAPLETLFMAGEWEGEDLVGDYAKLPDTIEVYRGVSTGIDHFEDGFSWSRELGEAWNFARLNCQTRREIPGVLTATVPKSAVLAMFSFEKEVVVDPTVPKVRVRKDFLRGTELRNFHKSFDAEMNTRNLVFKQFA